MTQLIDALLKADLISKEKADKEKAKKLKIEINNSYKTGNKNENRGNVHRGHKEG